MKGLLIILISLQLMTFGAWTHCMINRRLAKESQGFLVRLLDDIPIDLVEMSLQTNAQKIDSQSLGDFIMAGEEIPDAAYLAKGHIILLYPDRDDDRLKVRRLEFP